MKKTKINVNVNFKEMTVYEIRNILWKLCYKPEDALKELSMEKVEQKDVIDAILQQCKEEKINLLFAGEIPCADTLGIDMGISNPVVRDILIQKAYNAVESDNPNVGKAATLFTGNYPAYVKEAKIFGGLKSIKFSNEEATYLYNTCNLYPVGLLLKKLIDKKEEENAKLEKVESIPNLEVVSETVEIPLIPQEEKEKDTEEKETFKVPAIIKNKEKVQEFLNVSGNVNFDTLDTDIENLQNELKRLQSVKTLLSTLEAAGVSLEMLKKTDKIVELFKVMEALES